MAIGRLIIRILFAALGVAATLGMATYARADESPDCDSTQPATWRTPAIDPATDIIGLFEKTGWTTIGGEHISPHVLAVKDVRRSPFSDEQGSQNKLGRNFCYAIVETDNDKYIRNFIFKYWYEVSSAGYSINGIMYRPLYNELPDDITIERDGPYLPDAEGVVSQLVMTINWVPFCERRSKAWADVLRKKLLEAIPADRPDLRERAEKGLAQPLFLTSPNTKNDCLPELNKDYAREGDEIVAGKRTIWGDPYDRRR